MPRSRITSKYRTTVPRDIRDALGASPADVLVWELRRDGAMVHLARNRFLEWRGTIGVGSDSAVEDVRKARRGRGTSPR